MDFETAKKIVDHIKSCDVHINGVIDISSDIKDVEERKVMLRRCGEVMGVIYSEILRPIELEHPTLKI